LIANLEDWSSLAPFQRTFNYIKNLVDTSFRFVCAPTPFFFSRQFNIAIRSTKNLPGPGGKLNVLRIAIHSLGSPAWMNAQDLAQAETAYLRFLHALRGLLRFSLATCVVTFPAYLFSPSFVTKVEHLVDTAVALESFAGSFKETNPAFQEYHGLFHVRKLPRLNTIAGPKMDTTNLAFKLQRKRFSVETFHLPPELEDTTSRTTSNADHKKKKVAMSCTTTGGGSTTSGANLLDF